MDGVERLAIRPGSSALVIGAGPTGLLLAQLIASGGAAIAALRTGRVRTHGLITHRFALDDFGTALAALTDDPTAHKVVIDLTHSQDPA